MTPEQMERLQRYVGDHSAWMRWRRVRGRIEAAMYAARVPVLQRQLEAMRG
jgi:hypothetical protein